MARGPRNAPSKSALQQKEEEDAARRAEVPMFSFEGLTVHRRRFAFLAVGVIVLLIGSVFAGGAITSPSAVDLSSPAPKAQAKAGEVANFTFTVRNSALFASYAYETHVLNLPSGWSAKSGETAFALSAGGSRDLQLSIGTAPDASPGHDYTNITLKVLVKTGDLNRTLASKSIPLTVHIVPSSIGMVFENRVTNGTFAGGAMTANLNFTPTSCGASSSTINFEAPADANITNAGFTVNYDASDSNATGWLAADVGADGSIDGNVTLSGPAPRINLGPSGFVNYSLNHPAPSGSLVVPVAITSCMNATSWNATLNNALLGYQFPTPAGAVTPADTSNPNSPQALVHFLARLTNDEPRPVSLIVGLPTLPTGWDFTPALATTPINVPPGGSNLLDFTLRVAKSTAEGEMHLDFQACIQANPRDCATAPATVSMPAVPYFTVKTYIEPATLKEVYRGRSTDVLLFAQNLGNEPTAFEITVGSSPGLNVSFYDGSGPLSLGPQTQVPLALNETRLFVMHVSAIPGASSSVYSLNPTFRNASAGIVQSNLFMSFNLIDPTIDPKVAAVGSRLSVDFTGVTASGLLFDTNQFSMLPLIDQHQRATHPQYVKPAAGSVTPYEVAIQELANYTGTAHKGFEPYLVGSMERETIVFWLTPAQTALPQTAFLKDETLIFEVHITIISAL